MDASPDDHDRPGGLSHDRPCGHCGHTTHPLVVCSSTCDCRESF